MNRNRKFLLIAGAVCALAPLAGCLVLPFPHYRDHLPACSGVVVDAASGMPVAGASVTAMTSRYSGTAVSDEEGRFSIDGTGGWHWIVWIATPSSGSFFPTHLHPQDEWLTGLRVQRKGAEDKWFSLEDLPDCGLCGGTNFVLEVAAVETFCKVAGYQWRRDLDVEVRW